MKNSILIFLILSVACTRGHDRTTKTVSIQSKIQAMAKANGLSPSASVVNAIARASAAFKVNALHLTAIGIIETGLGKNSRPHYNSNGTVDKGIFQVNTVNLSKCRAFQIETVEGSAFCAAKLLSQIKIKSPIDIAKYHSKTPAKKRIYFAKLTQVFGK